MIHSTLSVSTGSHDELRDITKEVEKLVRESGILEGLCTVYIPHTTCGVTINENVDPSVKRDILMELDRRIRRSDRAVRRRTQYRTSRYPWGMLWIIGKKRPQIQDLGFFFTTTPLKTALFTGIFPIGLLACLIHRAATAAIYVRGVIQT
jgi:hypothetical protein